MRAVAPIASRLKCANSAAYPRILSRLFRALTAGSSTCTRQACARLYTYEVSRARLRAGPIGSVDNAPVGAPRVSADNLSLRFDRAPGYVRPGTTTSKRHLKWER